MEIFVGILVGLFTVIGIAVLIKVNRDRKKANPVQEEPTAAPASDCCGAHEICELDAMKVNTDVVEYYDDEELDRYKNINQDAYSGEQIDQFRDILYTLKTDEIPFWLLSIERRKINLPDILISEARMLMAEA